MNEDKSLLKLLKWAGIAALLAIPVMVYLKNKKNNSSSDTLEDEMDIYSIDDEK
ncbi:MAG: hypothetical protein HY964_00725 [Ignavibacteriales bacterium]|nr:hypothetical protein [Ignavibacteriales bacterium]